MSMRVTRTPQRSKHARVFATNYASSDHRERMRQLVNLHDIVAGKDLMAVEPSACVPNGFGADSQHYRRGRNPSLQGARPGLLGAECADR
jgi:hypothetical protein